MTTFVRSYMENGQFFRKNVYKVELYGATVMLTPMFGKFRDIFTIGFGEYQQFLENTDLIPVQPMCRIADDNMHFMHDSLGCAGSINWVNAATSGIMNALDLRMFAPTQL